MHEAERETVSPAFQKFYRTANKSGVCASWQKEMTVLVLKKSTITFTLSYLESVLINWTVLSRYEYCVIVLKATVSNDWENVWKEKQKSLNSQPELSLLKYSNNSVLLKNKRRICERRFGFKPNMWWIAGADSQSCQ